MNPPAELTQRRCLLFTMLTRIGTINATSGHLRGAAGVRPGPKPDPAPGTARLVGAKAGVGLAITR